jgi:hypothetical protein
MREGEGFNLPPAWADDFLEPHTHCWFGPGNVTAAGWKLGEVQDEDEGHHDGQGQYGAEEKPDVGVVSGIQMLVDFLHGAI